MNNFWGAIGFYVGYIICNAYYLLPVALGIIGGGIGFYTGKWIYTADALDDMKKDAKSGSYNPFNLMFPEGIPEKDREMIKGAFVHSLAGIEMAADLIECSDESLKGIIYNIIYCGMKRKSDEITDKIITAVK